MTANTAPEFNAAKWLNTNCFAGKDLHPETVAAVSSFTLMWNMFEGVFIPDDPTPKPKKKNIDVLKGVAQRISDHVARVNTPINFEPSLSYWTQRYYTSAIFNYDFEDLRFRHPDERTHVETVLKGERQDEASRFVALLLIIQRLRNNLFHGLKVISKLNEQVDNLNTSSRFLASILEHAWKPVAHPSAAQ